MDMYSDADDHDAALSSNRDTFLRERLDRVIACERYAMRFGNDGAGLDLLNDQLSERALPGGFPAKTPIRSEMRAHL